MVGNWFEWERRLDSEEEICSKEGTGRSKTDEESNIGEDQTSKTEEMDALERREEDERKRRRRRRKRRRFRKDGDVIGGDDEKMLTIMTHKD